MLEHIPAGVNPDGHEARISINNHRDAVHTDAADEHAAFIDGVGNYVKQILREYENERLRHRDILVQSRSYGEGALVIAVSEEAPALPELVTALVDGFRTEDYIELRAEGIDISPDYDMPEDRYKYVFHYGG